MLTLTKKSWGGIFALIYKSLSEWNTNNRPRNWCSTLTIGTLFSPQSANGCTENSPA